MPFVLIIIGLIYFIDYDVRAWSMCGNIDNYALVNSYTNTAIFGLWMMFAGGVWLWLRKR